MNNVSMNASYPVMSVRPETIVWFSVLYSTIFVLSAIGNTMVCTVVYNRYRSKTLRNYYVLILNLAISDLLAASLALFDIAYVSNGFKWIYGRSLCFVLPTLQNVSYYTSVWTLAAISLVRYRGIIYPLGRQVSNLQAMIICVSIWLLVLLARLPSVISTRYTHEMRYCRLGWDREKMKINEICMTVLLFAVPFLITVVAYSRIAHRVSTRVRMASKSDAKQAQETRKIIRMLVVATSIFFICVIPLQVVNLLDLFQKIPPFEYGLEFMASMQILTLMHTTTNPICYTLSNDQFRKEAYASCCCKYQAPGSNGRSTFMSKSMDTRSHAPSVTTVEFIGCEEPEKPAAPEKRLQETRF